MVYQYGLLDEFAVAAYWTGRCAECVEACDRLLTEGKLPSNQRCRVLKNKQVEIAQLSVKNTHFSYLPINKLLMGGENDCSGAEFARLTGDLLRPSTPICPLAAVEFLETMSISVMKFSFPNDLL